MVARADGDALAGRGSCRCRADGRPPSRTTGRSPSQTPCRSIGIPGTALSASVRIRQQLVLVGLRSRRCRCRSGSRSPRRARPTPAMFGVPASNLFGSDVVGRPLERHRADHVAAALIRRHLLEERRACRTARRCRSGRTSCGRRTRRSRSRAPARRPACAAPACAPSTSTGTPRACAISMISATGLIVPSAFDTWTTATSLVRSVEQPLELVEPQLARVGDRDDPQLRAFSSQSSCHGTMFEWCSISVTSISSPAPRFARPNVCATRLMASVVPRTKTISRASGALRNAAP